MINTETLHSPPNNNPSNGTASEIRETRLNDAARAEEYAKTLATQFVALPMAIFADVREKKLKHRDVCLYAHLLVKQGTKRSSFWGIQSLALLTGTHQTGVKESIRRLASCGHIQRERRGGAGAAHTTCLTKLEPGQGSSGIRVKGERVADLAKKAKSAPPVKASAERRPAPPKHRPGQERPFQGIIIPDKYADYGPEAHLDFIEDTDAFLSNLPADF